MKTFIAFLFGVALTAFLLSLAERDPLRSHSDYMRTEYGNAYKVHENGGVEVNNFFAYLRAEMKIDKYLLELESR